jgi:hypothetical protein
VVRSQSTLQRLLRRQMKKKTPLYRCSFKFIPKVGVEESIVNAPWITDYRSAV